MTVCPILRHRAQRDHNLHGDDGVSNPLAKTKSTDHTRGSKDLFGAEMVNPVADPSPRATKAFVFNAEGVPADADAEVSAIEAEDVPTDDDEASV